MVQMLRAQGKDKLADALEHAFQTGTGTGGDTGANIGDTMDFPGCGKGVITDYRCGGSVLPIGSESPYEEYTNCSTKTAQYPFLGPTFPTQPQTNPCNGNNVYGGQDKQFYGYRWYKFRVVEDTSIPIPDELSDAQAQRLLDKIEEFLNTHKDQMESELDDLLKKNLNDIDWPKFDNDEAKRFINDHAKDQITSKLDDLRRELEDELNKPDCENEADKCKSTTCCNTCKVVELQREIRRLEEKSDDMDHDQLKEELNETYDAPGVPDIELKRIDFQPVVDLKGELMSKFPFNMLALIPSAFEVLTAAPVAPYWDANLGEAGGTHRVDFSVLNSLASFIRLVLSWLSYIGAVFCCLKIWSRF